MVEQLTSHGEFGLRDYLRVLTRRRKVVVLTVVALLGVTLVLSFLKTPMYAAEAKVVLRQDTSESVFQSASRVVDPARLVQTEIEMLQSKPVEDKVREAIGITPDITARALPQADVIAVRATSDRPENAATFANVYAQAYIDVRREQAVNDLVAAAKQVQGTVSDLQQQIDQTNDEQQRVRLRDQQALFREKLDQLQVDSALKRGGADLASPAKVPEEPFSPRPIRSGVLALGVGLFLGMGLAFLFEFLDDTVKAKEDLERVAPGLQTLGLIPDVSSWKSREEAFVVSTAEPTSAPAEAYRTLRTAVQFLTLDRQVRTLQVTSANAQEGKSTTLANLAVAFARAGRSVAVVCCDLRRPRIHEFFGVSNAVGLTSVVLGDASLSEALQPTPVDRVYVLASGPLPPNPSELLATRLVADVLDQLVKRGFIVLIDSPPILPVTDGMVLSKRVDATLLVCVAGRTTRRDVGRAVELLEQVDAPLIGAVLNGVAEESTYGYSSYGYYTSASPEEEEAGVAPPPVRASNGANGYRSRSSDKPRKSSRSGRRERDERPVAAAKRPPARPSK